jgi:hypothetical protein
MTKFAKRIIIIVLTLGFALGSLSASGVVFDAYRMAFGEPRWHEKYNNFVAAVQTEITGLGTTIANLFSTVDSLTLIQTAPTYSDNHTFTVAGDYSALLTPGKRLVADCAADGLKPNTVVSCTYAAPTSTVVVTTSNLTANLAAVSYYATRNGLNTYGSGDIVAGEFGAPSWGHLQSAVALANSSGRRLLLTPGSWAVSDNLTITAPVHPVPGATFAVATTKTLTMNGPVETGNYQIFACTGTGKADFGVGSVQAVYPEWWGIATDAATMAAFQAAVNTGLRVIVTGQYTLDNSGSALMLNSTTNAFATLEGAHGWSHSWLQFTSNAHPGIQYGFTTGLPNISIKNLALYGPGGTVSGNFGFYFPAVSYNAARIVITDVLVRSWGDDGIRLDGPAGPISIENAAVMDCRYGIKISTSQDVTIRGGSVHSCLGGISVDGGALTVGSVSIYDTDIELAAATLPALYLKGSYGNVFRGLTLAVTPGTLSVGDAVVYLDAGCHGNVFDSLLINAAGGLNNFYIQGNRNTIIGGFHYNNPTPTGDGYFIKDHGTYTTVINPLLGSGTFAAGKGIVYNDSHTGVFIGVPVDSSGRTGVLHAEGSINIGPGQIYGSGGDVGIVNNAYYDGGWKYLAAGKAMLMAQYDGIFYLNTSAAGASSGDPVTWIRIEIHIGADDPTAGSGIVAPIGSLYTNTTTGQLYSKTSAPNTGWTANH